MKVTFVITSLSMGGAQGMLLKLLTQSEALRGGGVISLRCGGELEAKIRELGVDVDCLGMHSGLPDPAAIWRLLLLLRRKKPDVISSWMYHADLLAGLAARIAGVPVVWGIRNSNIDPRTTKRLTRYVIRACAMLSGILPARIVSCSTVAQELHVQRGYRVERFAVIPNGFDLRAFHPSEDARLSLRRELGIAANAPLVGLVARFDPQKNHVGFLEAAMHVHDVEPEVRFLMVGEEVNADNRELHAQVEQSGISSSVFMLGPRSDMPRIMASLDVLVLSSSYGEAFPNVVGEAMACEVPCVVTDVGDSSFVVGDTGFVVPPLNSTELAEGILRLVRMGPQERLSIGKLARRRIEQHFDLRSVARQYESLLRQVATEG